MPLTAKGEEIKAAMTKEYGAKKGEEVFYASRNKGTITGVDAAGTFDPAASPVTGGYALVSDVVDRVDALRARMDSKYTGRSLKQLREEKHECQMMLERAIRNKDAEHIKELRDELDEINKAINRNDESRNDAGPGMYQSKAEALAEVKRLREQNPGKTFKVFEHRKALTQARGAAGQRVTDIVEYEVRQG